MHRIINLFKISALTVLCGALFTFTYACSTSTVISNLNAVIAAADVAVGVLEANGNIPVPTANLIAGYLSIVSTASSEAAIELQSNDPTSVKVSNITHFFSTSVMPNIQGFPPAAIGPVTAVDAAVRAFLASIGTSLPGNNRVAVSVARNVPQDIHISHTDRSALKSIAHKGLVVSQKARAVWK